jgi:hypothetical protein
MKTSKTVTLAVLSAMSALIILSPTALAATTTPMVMGGGGIIVNAGTQSYSFSGGAVAQGEVLGNLINPGAHINFHVSALVSGLSTSGSGQITIPASGVSGGHGAVVVQIQISGENAAAVFPLNQDGSSCTTLCTSEIPILFTGEATISSTGHSFSVPIAIESPYWNPFGGPIVITSEESNTPALFLVATYNSANINWNQVVLQGQVFGSYGLEQVSGYYTTITNSNENLFAGKEVDSGQIAFVGMTDTSLNGAGTLKGSTTIPAIQLGVNAFDCTSAYALALGISWPFGPGTCTLTGASSGGSFHMSLANGAHLSGAYQTSWSVPSLTTGTSFTATVTQ